MNSVWINVKSVQQLLEVPADSAVNTVEVLAKGRFAKKGRSYVIDYSEVEDNQNSFSHTTIKAILSDAHKEVTITKKGSLNTILTVVEGARNISWCQTEYSSLRIGILGELIRGSLNENGGSLEFHYKVDINSIATSNNFIQVLITPIGEESSLDAKSSAISSKADL